MIAASSVRRAAVVLAGLLVLVLAWMVSPRHVPVYDGVNAPDEPYRYISAPAGAKAPKGPATSASASSGVKSSGSGATNAEDITGSSKEQGPQVAFYIPAGGVAPVTGSPFVVTATPKAPSGPPANGPFVGNAYVVAVMGAAAGSEPRLTPTGASGASIQLRAPNAKQPGPTIEWQPSTGGAWQPLTTARTGQDIYTSRFAGFGTYVLVQAPQSASSSGGGGGVPVGLIVLIVAVVLLIGVIVVVRVRRSGRAAG